ncbi:MAG TPA: SLC13 family permease [Alphaproteobacteria bacterium]
MIRKLRLPVLITGLAVIAAAGLVAMPTPAGVQPEMMRAAALVLVALALFATNALPGHISAVAFLTFGMLCAVAPAETVFAGFSSTAVWLVFGGLIVGVAIRATGLGERMALQLMRMLGTSYLQIIGGIMIASMLFSFIMPASLGRVVILMPIMLSLAEKLGFPIGSKGHAGLVVAAGFGTLIPAFTILPANVPNMVLAGAAETTYGLHLSYGSYALLHAPMSGLGSALIIFAVIMLMFRDTPKSVTTLASAERRPWSADEKKLSWILGISLVLWMTDGWHGISPAWVGMAGGLACMLPRIGVLPPSAFNEKVQFGGMFYVAGVLGLGAVVAQSGLGTALGHALMQALDLQPGETARNFVSLILLYTLSGLITTMPALPAVLTPLGNELAQATGFPLLTVLMLQVIGFSSILLPYQMAPMVLSLQMGRLSYVNGVKATFAVTLSCLLLLTPLNYLWWRFLGYLS